MSIKTFIMLQSPLQETSPMESKCNNVAVMKRDGDFPF